VVRDGDLWAMNNGNTLGKLVYFPAFMDMEDVQKAVAAGVEHMGEVGDSDNAGGETHEAAQFQEDKVRYVDLPLSDGLPDERDVRRVYDFDGDEPYNAGQTYARGGGASAMRLPPARPGSGMRDRHGRPLMMPRPNAARRRPLPDPVRDPRTYRDYWYSTPRRGEDGDFFYPYPRRYWPNMLGADENFYNPFLGRSQVTRLPAPWGRVVTDGHRFDFGGGRVITGEEFSQLYALHEHFDKGMWVEYNRGLQSDIQLRNPHLDIPLVISETYEGEGEFPANISNPDKKDHQTSLEDIQKELGYALTPDNVRVTGRRRGCKSKLICFASLSEELPAASGEREVFLEEYERQLSLQEQYMNKMGPGRVRANMAAYELTGRTIPQSWHQRVRKVYSQLLEKFYKKDGVSFGIKEKVKEDMSKLAILYNPDMVAGGEPDFVRDPTVPIDHKIGLRSVNSSIGAQWRSYRLNQLKAHLEEQIYHRCESPQIQLRICDRQGRPQMGKSDRQ